MRMNHLQPPFDNPGLHRAILGAVSQTDVLTGYAPFWNVRRPDRPGNPGGQTLIDSRYDCNPDRP